VGETLHRLGVLEGAPGLRLVKGSHIVIPRHFGGDRAYCFQGADGRVVFAIPYEGRFTLVGTTEEAWEGDPAQVVVSEGEIRYLCATVSDYFREPVAPRAVAWSYAGVRPLYDEGEGESASAVSRDYVLDMQPPVDEPPALHVMGGKITTYRRLAERALELLAAPLAMPVSPWTANAPLPGGDLPAADFDAYLADAARRWKWLPAGLLHRLLRAYGTRIERVLGGAAGLADLGEPFGAGLHEAELEYLVREEWAATAEDVLWRRSKLGLHMDPSQRAAVTRWFG
jgi:glycerol-3-phosphate dehydrogenase